MPSKRLTQLALAIKLTLSLLSLPLATIKLNGVDTTLNPILGTDKNDKLTASGESVDNVTASLAGGKDLVQLTAANEFDDEAKSNMTVEGGDGSDVINAVDGLLTVTGQLSGNADDDEIEVDKLYERLKQSVHLREGFRLYHKMCMEEHAANVQTAAVRADVDMTRDEHNSPQAGSPPSPGAEEVRKANAERFAARIRRKRAKLPRSTLGPGTFTSRCV